eukprot:1192520-Prorocentrum_minimum.AAC.1
MTLAEGDDPAVAARLARAGMRIDGADEGAQALMGYILFDTRVDRPELQKRPGDPGTEWMAAVKVRAFPEPLFMLLLSLLLSYSLSLREGAGVPRAPLHALP